MHYYDDYNITKLSDTSPESKQKNNQSKENVSWWGVSFKISNYLLVKLHHSIRFSKDSLSANIIIPGKNKLSKYRYRVNKKYTLQNILLTIFK